MRDLPNPEVAVKTPPLVIEPLDIQHDTDPADDHGPARRIPHLGHAILFFSLATFCLVTCLSGLWALFHIHTEDAARAHPGVSLAAEALAYILTLAASAWIFPRLWDRSFLRGIEWNFLAARRRWPWVVLAAILLSAAAQFVSRFIHSPSHSPVDDLMSTTRGAWLTAAFGVLLAPLTEEIAFRGFLLPALATAYDWLALDRTPAGLQRWESSTAHSPSALLFAAIFSSVPFALLHADQLSHSWGAIGVLYSVSLFLSLARIKTHSLSCSTLMHATYNLTVFVAICISTNGFRHLDQLKK